MRVDIVHAWISTLLTRSSMIHMEGVWFLGSTSTQWWFSCKMVWDRWVQTSFICWSSCLILFSSFRLSEAIWSHVLPLCFLKYLFWYLWTALDMPSLRFLSDLCRFIYWTVEDLVGTLGNGLGITMPICLQFWGFLTVVPSRHSGIPILLMPDSILTEAMSGVCIFEICAYWVWVLFFWTFEVSFRTVEPKACAGPVDSMNFFGRWITFFSSLTALRRWGTKRLRA